MTDGERAIWAAAFVRRLLDKSKPSDHDCATQETYLAWQKSIAIEAVGAASDVVRYARIALDALLPLGGETHPLVLDLRAMLGWKATVLPAEEQKEPSGDGDLPSL